jgi:hypothetical protein
MYLVHKALGPISNSVKKKKERKKEMKRNPVNPGGRDQNCDLEPALGK